LTMQHIDSHNGEAYNLGVNNIRFVQDDPQSIRLENIIDMGLGFSAMIRLFDKGSNRKLHEQILIEAQKIFIAESEEDFKTIHLHFCKWGVQQIILAEKRKNGQVIKKSGPASFGQVAKTLDVVLKVAVYYCHLPDCEKSQKISGWLNAAVDTKMMGMLKACYPSAIVSWPNTIEQVDGTTYKSIQAIVRKFILERHVGNIIPVQFDDIYWRKLNRI